MEQQRTDPPVSLRDRLFAAQQDVTRAQVHLSSLTGRIKAAVGAEDFAQAQQLKEQLPDARAVYGEAAATAKALELVLADLDQQQAAHDAVIEAEQRRVQAQRVLDNAGEMERDLTDRLQAVRAELAAGVEAVRDTIHRGYALEEQIYQARAQATQALVELGQREAGGRVSRPNFVSAWVDRSSALTDIRFGRALPA
jgi:phage shock protein A